VVQLESFVIKVIFSKAPEAQQKRNRGLIAGPCKSLLGGTSFVGWEARSRGRKRTSTKMNLQKPLTAFSWKEIK
jgi:hypothetical protein